MLVALVLTVVPSARAQSRVPESEPAAAVTTASSDVAAARGEAQLLFRDVMSPFCPGLTLADCPSPAAFELRRQIEARLVSGETRPAVVDGLVEKYGTSILSDPSSTPIGRVVWGVPFALSALAALGLALFVRRATRSSVPAPMLEPTPALRHRVDEELAAID